MGERGECVKWRKQERKKIECFIFIFKLLHENIPNFSLVSGSGVWRGGEREKILPMSNFQHIVGSVLVGHHGEVDDLVTVVEMVEHCALRHY